MPGMFAGIPASCGSFQTLAQVGPEMVCLAEIRVPGQAVAAELGFPTLSCFGSEFRHLSDRQVGHRMSDLM